MKNKTDSGLTHAGQIAAAEGCAIIANHHSAREIDTPEFRVVWDADWLVNLQEDFDGVGRPQRRAMIDRVFRTDTGRPLATELFASNEEARRRRFSPTSTLDSTLCS